MKERELDLLDMLFYVLSHWRSIIVFAIIGALLIGGVATLKSMSGINTGQSEKTTQLEQPTHEEQLQAVESKLTEVQKASVLSVISDEEEYAIRKEYLECSAIMQMNPNNVYRIELIYVVEAEDISSGYNLASVYADLINGVGLTKWVEEQTGIPAMGVDELVTAESKSRLTILTGEDYGGQGRDSLKVNIINVSEEKCSELANLIENYIDSQYEMMETEFGMHDVALLSKTNATVFDTAIADRQVTYSNTLVSLLNSIAKSKDAFSEEQDAYYQLLVNPITDDVAVENQEPTTLDDKAVFLNWKMVAVGALVGAVFYVGGVLLVYVMNNRLRLNDELPELYDIPQLGLIVRETTNLFFVDKWIRSLRNRGKRTFTQKQSINLATTAVKIAVNKIDLKSICLMGCDMETVGTNEICNKIKESLKKDNITITILNNVLYDAEAMAQLDNIDGVVLIEKVGSTMYCEITDELELVRRQHINVIGGILVE